MNFENEKNESLLATIQYYMDNGKGKLSFIFYKKGTVQVDCNSDYDVNEYLFVTKKDDMHIIIPLDKITYICYHEK